MRSLMVRLLFFVSILMVGTGAFAHDVTITGTQTFASLDGSSSDHDGAANGVFTVNDGNLVVSGVVTCNDDATTSGCSMSFVASGNVSIASTGALYAENRSGGGTGGAISISAGGNLAIQNGGIVSSSSRSSSGATGGNISVSAGSITIASGGTIDSGSANAPAGKITLTASGLVSVDGNVLAGPSRTLLAGRLGPGAALDGGTSNQVGGEIAISSTSFVQPAVVVGTNASIVSQGETTGAGPVSITGCGIEVRGLVAALSKKDSPAKVSIRSGQGLLVDSRDLGVAGATLGRNGRVRADAPSGTAVNKGVDLFAAEGVQVHGPAAAASALYAVTSMPGLHDAKSYGGLIRIMSTASTVTASGNVIDSGRSNSGDTGGTIEISAKGNVNLDTAVIRAIGDFNTNNPNRGGGSISVRSYAGNVVWTNGVGEVRPVGSDSGLVTAEQGVVKLTACGSVTTTGTSFPLLGTATFVFPNVQTGACSPAAPSLPAGVPPFVICNIPPVANDATASTNEDQSVTVTLSGSDADGDPLTFSIVSGPAHGSLGTIVPATATSATVVYTPSSNYNGSDSFVYQANDGRGGSDSATVTVTIAAVNDAPRFQAGPDATSLEDAGARTVNPWASSISGGPADESGQSVSFTVTGNSNPSLFAAAPQVSPAGVLTYTAAANAFGSATITIVAQDNGGTANGGVDTSAPQSFTITIQNVNDAPSFTGGANQTVNEDAGAQSVANWATAIDAGAGEGSSQSVSFNVTANSNAALFAAGPAVSPSGTLTFTPAADANGTATVTVVAQDNGGTANGGTNTSSSYTFTITVNAVNDAPRFTSGGNVTVLEDSAAYSAAWATGISAGPSDENSQAVSFTVTGNSNASLFSAAPTVSSTGALSFALAANAHGTATITVTATDDGGTANGGANTSSSRSFTITVTPVNDAPSFVAGANQTVNEDAGAQSVANWAGSISSGPNDGAQALTFSITGNSNAALFSAGPAIAADGTLSYTLAANANGSATITVSLSDDGGTANGGGNTSAAQSFTITVNAVNDAPSFTSGGNVTVHEDSAAYSAAWATAISAGPSDESSQSVSFNVTGNSNASLFSVAPTISSSGVLSFALAANAHGSATITITASDDGGNANGGSNTSASQSFTITVSPINDAPSFVAGANQSVNEDAGAQSVANWATGISSGPNDGAQALTFSITGNSNAALFAAGPSIAADGTLSYTLAANANGSATITVTLSDDGGTANGGSNTSAAQSFTITVNAVNDAPSFTSGGDVTVAEDSTAYSGAWATGISAGPSDESSQSVSFNVTANSNASLFSVAPTVSSSGVLAFTLAANAHGSATITITATDDGGTANGGVNTSGSQSFTISISAINDAPSFTAGANQTVNEDAAAQSVANWATGISAGPNETAQALTFNITGNSNPSLFTAGPAIAADGTLTYTLAANANGSATITVTLSDDGGTANGGSNTSAPQSFTITVTPVNDAPSFAGGGNVSVLEDAGGQTVSPWATSMTAGPADEAGQTFSFAVTGNSNPSLFSAGPSVAADGTLTYTPAANAFGSANVTVVVTDNGGTANGGADTSAAYTFTITVNPVNDAPSFTAGGDVTANEDAGPYSGAWATAISAGPSEGGQTVSFNVSNSNNALFSAQPALSPAGVLTFTTAANAFGTATVTVTLADNGGTAGGGVDVSASVTFTITINDVDEAPTPANDAWETMGNTELRVDLAAGTTAHVADTTATGTGVLDNDGDPSQVSTFSVTSIVGCADTTAPFDCTFANGAKLSMRANGSFSYVPGPSASSGSFQYVVSNGHAASATGSVTITVHDQIWYVRGGATGGNGTSVAPYGNFASLNGAGDVDAPGAYIFVHNSNVTGGIALETNQRLWGEGVGLVINRNLNGNGSPATLVAAGTRPTITNSGDTVSVNNVTGAEIAGLNLSSGGGNAIDVTSNPLGSNAASAKIYSNVVVSAGDEGIDVNAGGSLGTTVDVSNTSITASGNGFNVTSVGGDVAVSFNNGTITSMGGHGVSIDGSAGDNVVVTGLGNVTVHGDTAGDGIRVVGASFDAVAGGGIDVVNGGNIVIGAAGNGVTGDGIHFANVSGAYAFGTLNAWSVTGTAASITGTAPGFTVTSGGGTLSAAGGTGLSVINATIGATNLTFTSISSNGGTTGIVLTNTGTAGGLKVLGTGTANSGGTISNKGGHGIALTATAGASFNNMLVQGTGGSGVKGEQVVNFSFTNGAITNSGSAGGVDESSIAFNGGTGSNISGAVTITGNTLSNATWHGVDIRNSDGTLSSVNISNNTITSSSSNAVSKGSGIRVQILGSATTVAHLTRASFANNVITNFPSGAGIVVQGGNSASAGVAGTVGVAGSATDVVAITGNRIKGQSSAVRLGTSAILATVSGRGQGNFNISGNGTSAEPLTNIAGVAIGVSANGFANVTATTSNNVVVANNTLGSAGISGGTGVTFANTDTPTLNWTISGNSVSATDGNGILAVARGASGLLKAAIHNNRVAAPLTGIRQGIRVDAGNASSANDRVCLATSGNTSAGSGGATGIGLRKQGTSATLHAFGIVGLSPSPAATPAVEAYVDSQNPAGGTTQLLSATSGFTACAN